LLYIRYFILKKYECQRLLKRAHKKCDKFSLNCHEMFTINLR